MEKAIEMLLIPRNEWKYTNIAKQEASDYLAFISVEAGVLSYYLGYRGAFGCGDSGHEDALAKAEKKRKALRKAMGFSYP